MQERESIEFSEFRNRVGFGQCRGEIVGALDEKFFQGD